MITHLPVKMVIAACTFIESKVLLAVSVGTPNAVTMAGRVIQTTTEPRIRGSVVATLLIRRSSAPRHGLSFGALRWLFVKVSLHNLAYHRRCHRTTAPASMFTKCHNHNLWLISRRIGSKPDVNRTGGSLCRSTLPRIGGEMWHIQSRTRATCHNLSQSGSDHFDGFRFDMQRLPPLFGLFIILE